MVVEPCACLTQEQVTCIRCDWAFRIHSTRSHAQSKRLIYTFRPTAAAQRTQPLAANQPTSQALEHAPPRRVTRHGQGTSANRQQVDDNQGLRGDKRTRRRLMSGGPRFSQIQRFKASKRPTLQTPSVKILHQLARSASQHVNSLALGAIIYGSSART